MGDLVLRPPPSPGETHGHRFFVSVSRHRSFRFTLDRAQILPRVGFEPHRKGTLQNETKNFALHVVAVGARQ